MRDLQRKISFVKSFYPAPQTATVTGTGVDLTGYESAVAIVHVGAYTDGTHTPKLQESSDNSIFADVAAADLLGSFSALAANVLQPVGYTGQKRYIRVLVTVAGATTGALYGAVVIRGDARHLATGLAQTP
jgi:hypothetical protein